MKIRTLLLAATVLALPAVVQAQPVNGVYVGGGLGYNYLGEWKTKNANNSTGNQATAGSKFTGNGGIIGLGSVGYGFGNGLRVEGELGARTGTAKASGGNNSGGGGGTISTYNANVNVLYDFNVGSTVVYPYIGAGVGYAATQINNGTLYNRSGSGSVTFSTQSKGNFDTQAIIGASFPIASVPGLSITTEARAMWMLEPSGFGVNGHGTFPSGNVKMGDQMNYSALVGVRYAFGVAAPAAAVAPAPAPARTYLVFFDWDKADLSARAKQIIADAAAASKKVATTKIEVDGHADTSGSPAYNKGLSMRRAQAVAAELVKDGVPKTAIDIQAFGDTKPLVPTGPGVREPQNRRVEIILK